MNTKKWYQSKVIWLSVVQALAGILAAVIATNPTIQDIGYVVIVKSILDYLLRLNTTASIE